MVVTAKRKMPSDSTAVFLYYLFWIVLWAKAEDAVAAAACRPLNCDDYPVNPVCASDGMLYENECDIQQQNCRPGTNAVMRMPWSYCEASRCLHTACARNLRPTCGDDGQIHSNACMMVWASCGKKRPIVEIPKEVCLQIKCPNNCRPDDAICHSELKRCRDQWTFR